MQLSKNSINDNSIMNKRILIVHSGFSSWVHFNIYEINAFFMKRYGNYKIDALICNKAVTACDFQTTGNVEIYHRHDWQKKCETCIQHTKKRLTSFCSELIYQDLYIDDTDIKMVDSFLNALPEKITQDYYANLNFKGIEIGKRAYESFQYFLKLGGSIGDIDLIPGTVAYEFLSSSILHVISAKKILKNYDIIMINDIGQTSWGLWADVAFAYNKKVLLCDVNWLLNNPPLHYREITSRLYDDAYEARLRHPLFPGIHKVNYIFSKLSENQEYINKGKSILSNRFSEKRINEFDIHNKYCIPPNKKIVVIFTHLCWDNSLTFGHSFFNSYKKWLLTTYNEIIKNENIFWLFKLHPYELGNHKHVHPQYNTLNYLKKIVEEKPSDNVKLVDTPDINTSDLIPLMHTGITLAGTVSYELPSYGINCITLSAGLHSNLGFTIDVKNEDEYIQLLKNIENLTELDDRTKKMALAYTGLLHSNYISINVEELYGEEGYETKKLSSEKIEKYVDEYFDEFSEMIHRKNYNPLIQNKNSLDTIVPIQSTNAHRKVKIDSTLNLLVDIYRYASNKNSTHSISFRNSLKKGLYSIQNFSCPICNNEYEWHPIAYSVEGFKWNICKHCGLFQLNCRLPKNNMNDFYESGEYTDICTGGLINETRFMLDYKVTARLITALLKRLKYDFSQMNILDIGCGAGSTVLAMKELGATVKGYDLDSQKIQFGQSIIKEIEIGDALAYD
ncbi:Capsule polysaccharide biosynthesis, partial [Candidatus Magnetomorum sp. HK-1]